MAEAELRRALAALAAEDLPGVLAEARADARERAREKLADVLEAALLEAAAARTRAAAEGDAWYVFGVVRAGSVRAPDGTALVVEGALAAVVREVPLGEYGEEALRANLDDIAWLEDAARRHEAVLEGLLEQTTVIPLRLCTIYHDEAAVRAMLASEQGALTEALGRLEGHTEWGVKAFCDRATVEASARPPAGDGGEGEAYLARRRAEARARELVTATVDAAHERLAELAQVALANPLQRRELTGRSDDMALNGVYLVADERAGELQAVVERCAAEAPPGLTFELTGPWPPYNFVGRSVEAAR